MRILGTRNGGQNCVPRILILGFPICLRKIFWVRTRLCPVCCQYKPVIVHNRCFCLTNAAFPSFASDSRKVLAHEMSCFVIKSTVFQFLTTPSRGLTPGFPHSVFFKSLDEQAVCTPPLHTLYLFAEFGHHQ
jgi:hypothetical protein